MVYEQSAGNAGNAGGVLKCNQFIRKDIRSKAWTVLLFYGDGAGVHKQLSQCKPMVEISKFSFHLEKMPRRFVFHLKEMKQYLFNIC